MDEVAALYIDPLGPYPKLLGAHMCWDESRDARTYPGPWPVVAHPPCGPWGAMKFVSKHQDASGGPSAVEMVRRWGGVLEQPKGSGLWAHCGLPLPGELPDAFGGYALEVAQVNWGHPARKRTWLYIVGASSVPPIPPSREPTHWCWGTHTPGQKSTMPEGRAPRSKGDAPRSRSRSGSYSSPDVRRRRCDRRARHLPVRALSRTSRKSTRAVAFDLARYVQRAYIMSMKTNRMTSEQIVAGRAKVVAEIEALDVTVGVGSAYALAMADGTRAMPRELSHLFASRVRWEELTTLRRRWEAADAEGKHARMARENDR